MRLFSAAPFRTGQMRHARVRPALLAGGIAAALSFAAPAAQAEMTGAEREAFRAEVRAYLLENPEVLMEAIGVLENREAEAQLQADKQALKDNAEAIFNDPASWSGGNPEGDVTVVEFMDYRCAYCRQAYEAVEQLVEQDSDIRLVLKEYPVLGPASLASSRFAISVLQLAGPDAYKDAHDRLITLRGDPVPETLSRLATDMGLDAQAVLARMESPEVNSVIDANRQLGATLRIDGTPSFVINGTMVRGAVPLAGMQQIVASQRD